MVSQRELRNDSGAIMRRVAQGESFVVTRNGVPIADLSPHSDDSDERRRFVPVRDIERGLSTLPDWGGEQFRGELVELDQSLDDRDRDPWPPAP